MRIPELLAPVGNLDGLEAVVEAGADAVYLGGKELNMRVKRPGYNFTPKELTEIFSFLKTKGVKAYFTLNSQVEESQLSRAAWWLEFLESQQVDGLIVQDLGIINLAKKITPSLPLHASTQMNIHNSQGAKFLEELGVKRVVLARELSLKEIRAIREACQLELEFFVWGSRCPAYSGQCYLSSALGGGKGNQGRCEKHCRLLYRFSSGGEADYYLAPKDTSLLSFLPELWAAGITSWKIEGRMEESQVLKEVVSLFRQALDYCREKDFFSWSGLKEQRLAELIKRETTSGYLTGLPGKSYWQLKNQEQKEFAQRAFPGAYQAAPGSRFKIWEKQEGWNVSQTQPLLAVWVRNLASVAAAWDADIFYFGGEEMSSWSGGNFSLDEAEKSAASLRKKGKKVYWALPNIAKEADLAELEILLAKINPDLWDGLLVNSLGTLFLARQATKLPLCLDSNLNIFNSQALALLSGYGLARFCLHPEGDDAFSAEPEYEREAVIWGFYPGMILENCLREDFFSCSKSCREKALFLHSSTGRILRVETDSKCRTHLFPQKKLNRLREITLFSYLGIRVFRIDGRWLSPPRLKKLVELAQRKIREGLG